MSDVVQAIPIGPAPVFPGFAPGNTGQNENFGHVWLVRPCLTAKECEDQSEQLIVQVLGGRDFSTAVPRFALMWGCWKADQSIALCCKGEALEH
jgi:hypothetical protein